MNPISAATAAYTQPAAAVTPKPVAPPSAASSRKGSVTISPEAQALLAGNKDHDGDSQ